MYRSDTSEEVQKIYHQKIKAFSEEERFLRGLSLISFSRQLCQAGIRDRNPEMTEREMKVEMFETIYGSCFTPSEKKKIHQRLRK